MPYLSTRHLTPSGAHAALILKGCPTIGPDYETPGAPAGDESNSLGGTTPVKKKQQ